MNNSIDNQDLENNPQEDQNIELDDFQGLTSEIQELKQNIEEQEQLVRDLKAELCKSEVIVANDPSNQEEKQKIKQIKAQIKTIKNQIEVDEEIYQQKNREIEQIKYKVSRELNNKKQVLGFEDIFEKYNLHYVIFEEQWYSVDPSAGRMDLKITANNNNVILDLALLKGGIQFKKDTNPIKTIKLIANGLGRVYNHIVRDFNPNPRESIYNQMDTIRTQWLKPIFGVEPHMAFRILTNSIAGGDDDYADQLERFVAYRYCHPEDVMVPNIDSCAVGGTGRETFYNLIASIFTLECCGSVSEETFKGTFNGDLFGKMFVKIDEKNSNSVPIEKVKELTGGLRYRHRAMNQNARDVDRLFSMLFFRNGFTTTAKLAGTGSSGEDRRFEPIIARVNLNKHIAVYLGLIEDINQELTRENEDLVTSAVKMWQKDVWKNEERIAEWLGHIIQKHDAYNMHELLPLHGVYYQEMLERQKRGIDQFMPKFMKLFDQGDSTVISIGAAHKLYNVAESCNVSKDWFKNQMMYWLNVKLGWDCEEDLDNVYKNVIFTSARSKINIVKNKLNIPNKFIFDINDFIDKDAEDDKGNQVGEKINVYSIRDELR